jgi:cysteine desulfurase
MAGEASRVRDLRDRLLGGIRDGLNGVHVHGDLVDGLPGSLSVGFDGIDGAALLVALREVAVSTGAACASAEPGPSHVLRAIGVAEPLARATIRIGIGRFNTIEEIDFATGRIVDGVRRLRGES